MPRTLGMPRVPSRRDMRRSESAPTLAPVWEPNEGEEGGHESPMPQWLHAAASSDQLAALSGSCAIRPESGPHVLYSNGHATAAPMPPPWRALLSSLERSGTLPISPLAQQELVSAAQLSLQGQKELAPLHLRAGYLEDSYVLKKRDLVAGASFAVHEGVHRKLQRNYSIKIVSRSGLRPEPGIMRLDPMQTFYLVSSFVDEVFATPRTLALCMKWGTHEVDQAHRMSELVLDALDLLRELLPPGEHSQPKSFRLDREDLQNLLLRSLALDTFLQDNLFLE